MTDKPTVTFDAEEWRSVILSNLGRAHQFVTQTQVISTANAEAFIQHLDRIKVFVGAWHAAQPAATKQAETQPNGFSADTPVPPVEELKKRGGWPKGKKRTRAVVTQ